MQNAVSKACRSFENAECRYKSDLDKSLREANDRAKVGWWIFLDPSDAVAKHTRDDKSNLAHITEGPHKVLYLYERAAVIQCGLLIESVNVYRITSAPAPVEEPESHKYGATPADGDEKPLLDSLLKHRRDRNGTLELLVRWPGAYKQTWEPWSNISEKLISWYFER